MSISIQLKNETNITIGDNGTYDPEYLIFADGGEGEGTVSAALLSGVSGSVTVGAYLLVLKNVSVKFQSPGVWTGIAHYVPPESKLKQPGDSRFTFDTSGGSMHVTQSLSTISNTAPSGVTAPTFGGAIGVTHDSVEGCTITVPVYTFSETHYFADASVTSGYKGTLFNLTGKVNNGSFKGCAAGECLFLGASGTRRADGTWEIQFKFAASPNKTSVTVGSITVPAKKGWEYLWVRYEDKDDAAAKRIVKRPLSAHVEKVYDDGDFSGLAIGT